MFLELSAAPTGAEVSVKRKKCPRTYEPLLRQVLSKEIDPIRRAVAEKT